MVILEVVQTVVEERVQIVVPQVVETVVPRIVETVVQHVVRTQVMKEIQEVQRPVIQEIIREVPRPVVETQAVIEMRPQYESQERQEPIEVVECREIEQQVLLKLELSRHIVATGGSAVYSDSGMANLMRQGLVVFLDASLEQLQQRIHNYDSRGIARRPDQSFQDLFRERQQLYRHYAQYTIDCDKQSPNQIVQQIVTQTQAL